MYKKKLPLQVVAWSQEPYRQLVPAVSLSRFNDNHLADRA